MSCQESFARILDTALNGDGVSRVDRSWLEGNASAILTPPKLTSIRVNTLKVSVEEAQRVAQDVLAREDPRFVVAHHGTFADLLLVAALGPFAVSPAQRRVVVSLDCAQAVLRGSAVFAPGVLAVGDAPTPHRAGELVSIWADLEGRCTRGLRKAYPGKTRFVGNGALVQSREQLFHQDPGLVGGVAIVVSELDWRMPSFDALPRDLFYPQNLPSFLAVEELDVGPGMTVLDMCASPGGKASHIGAKLQNTGLLLAIDRNASKVARLKRTLAELGVACARVYVGDSTRLCSADSRVRPSDLDGELVPLAPASFDRILLDPPCSGLGQRPQLAAPSAEQILHPSIAAYQRRLLRSAAGLLKPGGILVYSTCTLTLAENERNVVYATKELSLDLLEATSQGGSFGLPADDPDGLPAHNGHSRRVRRFWPSGADDTIGFFFARLGKR